MFPHVLVPLKNINENFKVIWTYIINFFTHFYSYKKEYDFCYR